MVSQMQAPGKIEKADCDAESWLSGGAHLVWQCTVTHVAVSVPLKSRQSAAMLETLQRRPWQPRN